MAAQKRNRPQAISARECPPYSIAAGQSTLDADLNIKVEDSGFSHKFTFANKWEALGGSPPPPWAVSPQIKMASQLMCGVWVIL